MRRKRGDVRKRGLGGLVDIEFLVQYLQLVHAGKRPEITRPNLWDALDAFRRVGLLSPEAHDDLRQAYDFLRTVEGRLRIVHNRSGVDLPDDPEKLARLARRLNYLETDATASALALRADADRHTLRSRLLFHEIVGRTAGEPVA